MEKENKNPLVDVSPAVIVEAANLCDGHSLHGVTCFTDAGLPESFVLPLVQTHKSDMTDDTGKGIITDHTGRVVKELTAIKGLDLLRAICGTLDLEYNGGYFGRGRIAASMQTAIANWATTQSD